MIIETRYSLVSEFISTYNFFETSQPLIASNIFGAFEGYVVGSASCVEFNIDLYAAGHVFELSSGNPDVAPASVESVVHQRPISACRDLLRPSVPRIPHELEPVSSRQKPEDSRGHWITIHDICNFYALQILFGTAFDADHHDQHLTR